MAIALPLAVPAAEAMWAAAVYVGSAIVAAAGITAASHAIDDQMSENKISATQACPKSATPPPDCAELTALIKSRVEELKVRNQDMLLDEHGLYPVRPESIPPWGSWPGHLMQFKGKQVNLGKLMNQAYAKGCPISDEAKEWVQKLPPFKPFNAI